MSLPGIYAALRKPTLGDLVYSIKAFLAGGIALYIGFARGLENPYWSVLTVYIVLNPPGAGAIRSKAIFRFAGTLTGGAILLSTAALFDDQPGFLLASLIAVMVFAIMLFHLDRKPTNYFFFAIAITIAVVGLNDVTHPTDLFVTATGRIGEISLGILLIGVVDSVLMPEPITPTFLKTMGDWRRQARDWLIDALRGAGLPRNGDQMLTDAARERLRDLAKAVNAIDAKAIQLPFDVIPTAPRGRYLDLLRRRLVDLIAGFAAIEQWAGALRDDGSTDDDLRGQLDAVADWLQGTPMQPDADSDAFSSRGRSLAYRMEESRAAIDAESDQALVLRNGLKARVARLIRDWVDLAVILNAIATGRLLPGRLDRVARRSKPVRSIDYLAGAIDVLPLAIATASVAVIWRFTAWSGGADALLFAFVGCIFLVGQGQIVQSIVGLVVCFLISMVFVFVYQFVILPRINDFPMLLIVLSFTMIPAAVLMRMSMAGMMIGCLVFSLLALQNAYTADFTQSLETLLGALIGILIAAIALTLCAYDHARFATRRLAAAVHRDVLDLTRRSSVPARARFLSLAVDRISLYLTAEEQMEGGAAPQRVRMLSDLSLASHLLSLRQLEKQVGASASMRIQAVRKAAVDSFSTKNAGWPDPVHEPLIQAIAAAADDPAIHADPERAALRDAIAGMHLALSDVRQPMQPMQPMRPSPA